MVRIGKLKEKFLTPEMVEEAIASLTRTAKRNRWTPTMKRNWSRVLNNREKVAKEIYEKLNNQSYKFHPFSIFIRFENKKKRTIYASCPEDQIVDYILDACLKYVFMERKHIVHSHSYGSIKGKGQHELRKIVIDKVRGRSDIYVAICDTKKYYPTIKHDIMMKFLRQHIKDTWLLWLCEATISRMKPNAGMALGLASSNILGHVYHAAIDWTIIIEYGVKDYYRFCDDKIMISRDKKYLHEMVRVLRSLIEDVGQTMKSNWKIVRCEKQRFEFLGALINSRNAILKSSARRRIERRFKKEQKLEFVLERDYMRVAMSWAGISGSLKNIEIRNLIKHWVLKQYPEYFKRLWRAMEYIDQRKKYLGDLTKIHVPENIPEEVTVNFDKKGFPEISREGILQEFDGNNRGGKLGKDYFHLNPIPNFTETQLQIMHLTHGSRW